MMMARRIEACCWLGTKEQREEGLFAYTSVLSEHNLE